MQDHSSYEIQRLEAVLKLGLLDQPEEERFQRITRLARRHFRANACAITLIDKERAFCVARDGLTARQNPRSSSLCSQVVQGKLPLVMADQSADSLSAVYQDLISRLNLKFYAGMPLLDPAGYAVGVLCIMDHIPRKFSRRDLESLADFASIVENELYFKTASEAHRELISQVEKLRIRAFVDPLTNVWNRGAIFDILGREIERAFRSGHPLSVCMLDLDFFKELNDNFGHQAGDDVLREVCSRARSSIRPYDGLGRYGGEEFLIVFPETNGPQAEAQANRVRTAVGREPYRIGDSWEQSVTVSIGVAEYLKGEDIKELIGRADAALYAAKEAGRDRVTLAANVES